MITTRRRSGAIPKLTEAQTILSLFSNVALIPQTIGLIIESVCKQVNKRANSYSEDEATSTPPDSIEAYLEASCVPRAEIAAAGGVLQYWENARATRPRLAQMALDFLSAPASSVDAERAFSGGRLQVNHLQHGISSQTFKAQVAVGSWFNTPLMPDLEVATNIMRQKMKGADRKSVV